MNSPKLLFIACLAASSAACVSLHAQAAPSAPPAQPAPAATEKSDDTVVLSPFTVTTDKDSGYKATNTTSGTRLNTAIKDLPMPIEVITEKFIRDTGSKDLRESLRYSAGIQLQSQNDWGTTQGWAATTPGRINNPEGSTATADQSRVKIRGFLTEASLRDGFRRQNATDSVNLARVEVIRGPSSLLYGVGNFGGVVNYLVKQPSKKTEGEVTFEYGSYNLMRGTIDYTGPATDTVDYRLTAAYQRTDDYTDYKKEDHYFVAPIVTWQPFKDTKITFDTEFGKQNRSGIGFQNIRAVPTGFVNSSDGYNGGFLTPAGRNPKEFRWSGPDTFNDSKAWNILFKLEQKLAENLYFNVGYNNSAFSYDQLDVSASLQTPGTSTPAWAIANVTYVPLVSGQSGFPTGPQPATIGYQWNASTEDDTHEQIRADLTYKLALFETSKWLKLDNTFLVGLNYTTERYENVIRGTPFDRNMFKSPTDSSPFKAGKQADGSPDHAMKDLFHQIQNTSDAALYAVYQGRLLDEWVTLIAGARKDRSWNKFWHYNPQWGADGVSHNQGYDEKPVEQYGDPSRDTTYQYGIDVRLTRSGSLSLYAMKAESSLPNYDGAKDFAGNVIKAALGEDKEFGLKFDLFNGRVSGTISKFEITRTRVGIGNPGAIWWAPTASGTYYFKPNQNIVYQVNDLNPVGNEWNAAVVASTAQWNAAKAAGAVYQATNSAGNTNWYVNASSTTGAALMDAVFANAISTNSTGWWGWIYNFDNLTNNATVDYNGASPP
ncbi:MAG TPA: TonB-dependent receptor plug domain-containing protein, partial [Acidobacteriota bacterium]|nr:TonB-dependent receptor plug domain-containing protein [Acidobacteriota bacterium]